MEEVKSLSQAEIEQGFQLLLESVELLQQALNTSFFDAYIENAENLLDARKVRVIEGIPSADTCAKIEEKYHQLVALDLPLEEKRKVSQLVLLKGLMNEPLQANHQLTPDGIGFLMTYFVETMTRGTKTLTLSDITLGTGNLLYTAMTNLTLAGVSVKGYGVEVDDTILSVAAVNRDLMGLDVELLHQDSLGPILLNPVDVTIGDLPIGYYPDDERAKTFIMGVEEGHSYAHHLLMEQAMTYVKEAGLGVFLVPSNFLETDQADRFKEWIGEKVYLQAILKLPNTLFSKRSLEKSILILQNKGAEASQASEVLLAELPSLKDNQAIRSFMEEFRSWSEINITKREK